ncbi:MAG: glucose-6-phosphate isomerase, partial [Sinobacterium sp.]|nr:glucose-6-phosphate isomerase [Sinobacterium sp.]
AFSEDLKRAENFCVHSENISLDFSKNLVSEETIKLLLELASQENLQQKIQDLRCGKKVNSTEDRSALHSLLRCQNSDDVPCNLSDEYRDIIHVKEKLKKTSNDIYNGVLRGYTGKPFTDIVHIGIGGSDLGPAMVYQALTPFHRSDIQCHYVANICANDICETLSGLDANSTLFIIASKSFNTLETLSNANTAKQWLLKHLTDEEAVAKHFYAVSAKPEKAKAWGINTQFVFPFWDFVGGRYSTWSAIGLSLCIGLGYDNFNQLLTGASELDQHFFNTELDKNIPVIMGLLGIWYTNFHQRQAHAVVPYDHRLRRFPQFLQQLEMESTGKCSNLQNQAIDYDTCPNIWGEAGSNSQHSFFQKLHQGTEFTPIDFIAVLQSPHNLDEHQDWLIANCLAQSRALMVGQTDDTPGLEQHKFMPGNKPSSTLILKELTPKTLGALMALYEQKVYVQSVIWNVNAFDQWGVELGKKVSNTIKQAMDNEKEISRLDSSTAALLKAYLNT